jgi:hypothetical protein
MTLLGQIEMLEVDIRRWNVISSALCNIAQIEAKQFGFEHYLLLLLVGNAVIENKLGGVRGTGVVECGSALHTDRDFTAYNLK